ncbi:hypothetical protein URS_0091 [Acinetobacter ursingii]|nr:hypothetical protein URS_0091 [Acinetobacter ursingii]
MANYFIKKKSESSKLKQYRGGEVFYCDFMGFGFLNFTNQIPA